MKIYGEYVEYNTFSVPGCTPTNQTQDTTFNGTVPPTPLPFVVSNSCEPTWNQFYNDTLEYESGNESQLQYYNTIGSYSPLPNVMKYAVQNYPQFDLGIPDQYRVDVWQQDFNKDVAAGTVPQLSMLWIMSDNTTGPPNAIAEEADNDLAVGRVVDRRRGKGGKHLLHAGQHDPHDRADPRTEAHEPERPRGLTDEHALRRQSAPEQLPPVGARAQSGPAVLRRYRIYGPVQHHPQHQHLQHHNRGAAG
jgi:hypothetical protein